MRRIALIVGLAVAGLMLATGLAFAASATIIGQADNTFSAPLYNTDQGEVSQFQVNGGTHNVTSTQTGPDGGPLFRSNTVSGGLTPVSGTQFLAAGSYPFVCTIHPTTMSGTLQVSGNGAPQPRPSATLQLNTRKLSKVLKRGRLSVGVNSTAKVDDVVMVAKLGNTPIASRDNLAWFVGQQFDTLQLTKAAQNKLKRKKKATITVTATVPFGSPVSTQGKLT
jgi:plastocyanin